MNFQARQVSIMAMKRWHLFASFCTALALLAGCATLDEKQRVWIFQPSDTWGGRAAAARHGRRLDSLECAGERLHGLAGGGRAQNRWRTVIFICTARATTSPARPRTAVCRRWLKGAIDYRFGSTAAAVGSVGYEDARSLGRLAKIPGRPRYIFGHSWADLLPFTWRPRCR
jgi:hypothetical protein